jgi:hypothetical protein
MRSYHPVSHLLIAYPAGYHYIPTVHPHPHILSRYKERVTVMAELSTEFAVNMYPLAHGNPAGKRHIAVTPLRVLMKGILCLGKQHTDPFLCHHLCRGIL